MKLEINRFGDRLIFFEAGLLTAQTQEEVLSSEKLERSAGLGLWVFLRPSFERFEVNKLLNSFASHNVTTYIDYIN